MSSVIYIIITPTCCCISKKKLTLKCIVSGFRIKLVSNSDLQFYFFKVLRNFDGMISQAVTDNLEHGGVEVCRKTQVKMGLTWGLGG